MQQLAQLVTGGVLGSRRFVVQRVLAVDPTEHFTAHSRFDRLVTTQDKVLLLLHLLAFPKAI
jgi:hypothetical protein